MPNNHERLMKPFTAYSKEVRFEVNNFTINFCCRAQLGAAGKHIFAKNVLILITFFVIHEISIIILHV